MSKWGRLGILMCLILSTQLLASIGKVSLLKGEAIANRDNQTIALANGTTLEEHDLISTRANSQIQLTFEDKTVITLGSESILDINQYLNDAQEPKAKFKFNQGTFKSITGNIGKKAPENFNLETKTATIGIRGTTVLGQIGSNGGNGAALQPDIIGCSVGQIVVSNPSGIVTLNAGFATIVTPGQPPAPPMPLSATPLGAIGNNQTPPPHATTSPSSNAPTSLSETTNSVTSQVNQNNVIRDIEEQTSSIHVPFTPSKGLVVFDYLTNAKGSINNYSKNQDSIFYYDTTASLYTLNTTTGIYETTSSTLSTVLPSEISSTSTINNTNFKISEGTDNANAINISTTSLSYSAQLIHDFMNEILIAKISATDGNSIPYMQTMLIGNQSTTLSSDPVLYYLNSNYLFNNSEASSILQNSTDFTALAVNTTNKKALGIFLDEYGQLQIDIGKVDSHESVSLQHYSLAFNLGSLLLSSFDYQNSNGALYGSDNQALAVTGMQTSYVRDGDSTSYASAINIALKNSAATSLFHQDYSNHEILTGSMIDGTGAISDLSITLNKNTGTVSVSSTPLTIASTHSAYIYDDYFATLSTDTYKDTTILKDYLIAIPLDAPMELDNNDYVSWGYWGKNNITTNSVTATTSPFSTWVAGVKTDTSYINSLVSAQNQTFTYNGSVIGGVFIVSTNSFEAIKPTDNTATFNINFQTSSYTANLAFKTTNTLWASNATLALNGNTFNATNVNTAVNGSTSTTGAIQGNFYGHTAQAVAGNFALGTGAYIAAGSFKAIK